MTTAIIGLGNIGSRVASNLVAGGENVIVAARDRAKAQAFAKKVGTNVEAMSIEDALKKVDVLILEPIQRDLANKTQWRVPDRHRVVGPGTFSNTSAI